MRRAEIIPRLPGRRLPAILLLALALALPAAAGEPAPLLWQIEGSTPSWILGTIHLPDPRLLDLPPAVAEAFKASDVFYGELAMDAATMLEASARTMLPEGESLRGLLPPDLARRVTAYVERRGRDMALFDRFTVWAFMMQLTLLDEMDRMLASTPLDLELYQRAARAGKQTGGLETLDEQIGVFDSLSAADQADLLSQTLNDLEQAEREGGSPLEAMLDLYLAGDLDGLEAEARGSIDPDSASGRRLERLLVTDRNQRMAERMARMLRERPETSFFFAVGALHITGENGLPALLRRSGLTVSRVGAEVAAP